ncbi:hypothetical protein [Yoonia sp. R78084]|uniref:hypothetical protein n=1 Tax=Yoonia sp. R78084 TaxID=3093869 RepID=UPI0037DDD48F
MKTLSLGLAVMITATQPLYADGTQQAMEAFMTAQIMPWASDPVLIAAIEAQNTTTSSYDQAEIDMLDQLWRGYAASGDGDLINKVLQNAAADFLRTQVSKSGGAITEIFIMDARGLNVAASSVTSDYWQGDEAKFQETYQVGPTAVHFGDVELDDSTQQVQGQVSMTMTDHDTGQPIGAMTIGINLTSLM